MISPAYITWILSAKSATTPKSWVTRTIEVFLVSLNSLIKSKICAWIVTSSAVVGSSAKITFGLHANAMAIITLCLIPPDNSCGYCLTRSSALGMFTVFNNLIASFLASSFDKSVCNKRDSVICLPIFIVGLRDVIGSWNIIDTSEPLYCLNLFLSMLRTCSSIYLIEDGSLITADWGKIWSIDLLTTVLPHPDSPTKAKASPS